MNWTYIMYLPAIVSALWPLALLLTKKHPTRAQLLLSATMLIEAFAFTIATVIFRARTHSLFIYQYLFQLADVLIAPLFYIALCALAEPRGTSLRQRHSLLPPLLFIIGLSIGASLLGPRRYDQMALLFRHASLHPLPGDTTWNFMLLWSYPLFSLLIIIHSLTLLLLASRKSILFQRRFNSYYAENIHAPKLNSRPVLLLSWLFLPLAASLIILIALRPPFSKHILIALSLLLSLLQLLLGRYTYSLDYDARYLAHLIRSKL